MTAYYNECDPYAAQWLRNLIAAGHIAPGVVDERSVEDVRPSELTGFTQCHFFAGIGVWSYALRLAGWSDDRPVWTGSCPCQPFSAAGKGAGFADERHLWPAWFHLIKQSRPDTIFGEQVASKIGDLWIDLVQTDLEAMDYAFGAVPLPAAGFGAPHIRDRFYWVADTSIKRQHRQYALLRQGRSAKTHFEITGRSEIGRLAGMCGTEQLADTNNTGSRGRSGMLECANQCATGPGGLVSRMEHAYGVGRERGPTTSSGNHNDGSASERTQSEHGFSVAGAYRVPEYRPGPTNGHWRDADWIGCRDGKYRPVEPGTFPLATGVTNRVGRLRAYGNAICAEVAKEVIQAYMSTGEEQCSLF